MFFLDFFFTISLIFSFFSDGFSRPFFSCHGWSYSQKKTGHPGGLPVNVWKIFDTWYIF